MSVKEELHRLIDGLSEDDARQALDKLREFCADCEMTTDDVEASVSFVTEEEGRAIFDNAARSFVGLTGEEFLRAWDDGTLDRDDPGVVHVVMLIPFARSA